MQKVSLIMTTFNSRDHFRLSLQSALAQDYPDLELVIADGASTDGTLQEIQKAAALHENIRWVSEPDGGIYDGMNKGIRMSTGNIIAVFNDLFTSPDCVTTMVRAIEEVPTCLGGHADLEYFDEKTGKSIRKWQMGTGTFREGWMPGHPTLYLKREVYVKYGLYNTDYRVAADYEFMVRSLRGQEEKLVYLHSTMIRMFYGGSSNGVRGYLTDISEAYRALKENNCPHPALVVAKRIGRTLQQYGDSRRKE